MSKVLLFALVGLMAVVLITARSADKQATAKSPVCTSGRHGDPCVATRDCCDKLICNAYAHRCQVQITREELLAKREEILSKNKNKKQNSAPAA
ncbi:omega-conotoxin-like protein 1 [Diachasmimorpha longicaudata]|uniref:omega-conotoxin-like protein 1 n=1 Tax=Diachasmimorpha longicaudata TaxID=58733 RepID=UPI0030B8AF65